MAPRRRTKAKRRSSPKSFRILNAIESYAYASILTRNFAGTTPLGMLTAGADIRAPAATYGGPMTFVNADNTVSLGELIQSPDLAFQALSSNVMNNWKSAFVETLAVGVSFRLGKRILSRPIANINRNIMKPLLGSTIKI